MKWHDAQKAYDHAASLFIQAAELSRDADDRRRLGDRAELAMKGSQQLKSARLAGATTPHPDTQLAPPSTMMEISGSQVPSPVPTGERLSADELAVLLHTSNVNGRIYKPWIAQDVAEPMTGPERGFVDRHGSLELSDKQVSYLQWTPIVDAWARARRFLCQKLLSRTPFAHVARRWGSVRTPFTAV